MDTNQDLTDGPKMVSLNHKDNTIVALVPQTLLVDKSWIEPTDVCFIQDLKLPESMVKLPQVNGNIKLELLKVLNVVTICGWQDTLSPELVKTLTLMLTLNPNQSWVIGTDQDVTPISLLNFAEKKVVWII